MQALVQSEQLHVLHQPQKSDASQFSHVCNAANYGNFGGTREWNMVGYLLVGI
jgi:hypothetical protein